MGGAVKRWWFCDFLTTILIIPVMGGNSGAVLSHMARFESTMLGMPTRSGVSLARGGPISDVRHGLRVGTHADAEPRRVLRAPWLPADGPGTGRATGLRLPTLCVWLWTTALRLPTRTWFNPAWDAVA